jgi:hypothetical protein
MEGIINGLKQIKTRVDSGTITTVNGTETLLSKQLEKMIEEAINYTRCCTELNTSFKKGDKVIACGKLEGKVVSSKTETMVKVEIKGTTIGINARSLELKSI